MNQSLGIGGPLGLCRTLRRTVLELLDSSRELGTALMHRQVESCWQLMARQEQLAAEFHRGLELWQSLFADRPAGWGSEVEEERGQLREEIRSLQHLTQVNAALSRGFSGAVRRALDGLGTQAAKKGSVYNRLGRVAGRNTSMLVKRVG